MEFLKYTNIDLSEIIEEGLTRTIGKILSNTSTKDIDKAFKSFSEKDELLKKIKDVENKYKDSETFKSILNDLKSIYAIDFHGYSVLPVLTDTNEIESIRVYSVDKEAPRRSNFHVVWKSKSKQNVEEIVDKIEDIFFEFLDKDVTFKILGKPVKYNFNEFNKYGSINEISNSTFSGAFQNEIDDIEDEDKYNEAWHQYFNQTADLLKKAAKYTESSKYGRSVKCKFDYFDVNEKAAYINIDFSFEYDSKKYIYSKIRFKQKY